RARIRVLRGRLPRDLALRDDRRAHVPACFRLGDDRLELVQRLLVDGVEALLVEPGLGVLRVRGKRRGCRENHGGGESHVASPVFWERLKYHYLIASTRA